MSTRIARTPSAMRKKPRQARSRVTVDAILEAGARILSMDGWAGFTTNKVAELAGVSIGSLYQYFPDKQSLVDAIRRRHLEDCLMVMRTCKADGQPTLQFVTNLVKALIAAHTLHPGIHRVLLDEAPRSDVYRDFASAFEIEYLGHFAAAVAACHKRPPRHGDQTVALVICDAIDGVIHNAARRGLLDDSVMQAELVHLVTAYLEGAPDRQAL